MKVLKKSVSRASRAGNPNPNWVKSVINPSFGILKKKRRRDRRSQRQKKHFSNDSKLPNSARNAIKNLF